MNMQTGSAPLINDARALVLVLGLLADACAAPVRQTDASVVLQTDKPARDPALIGRLDADTHANGWTGVAPCGQAQATGRPQHAEWAQCNARETKKGRFTSMVLASMTVNGALGREEVFAQVKHHPTALRACFENGLTRELDLQEEVTLQWEINASGAAVDVQHQETADTRTSLGECLAREVGGWTFPPAAADAASRATRVECVLRFASGVR